MKKLLCEHGGSLSKWGYLLRHGVVYGWWHQGNRYLCCARPDLSWEDCEERALAFAGFLVGRFAEPQMWQGAVELIEPIAFTSSAYLEHVVMGRQLKMFE